MNMLVGDSAGFKQGMHHQLDVRDCQHDSECSCNFLNFQSAFVSESEFDVPP